MALRQWNTVPYDSALTTSTNEFLQWVRSSVIDLQGAASTLTAPVLAGTPVGSAHTVSLTWSGQPGAVKYAIYESLNPNTNNNPLLMIDANLSGGTNVYIRKLATFGFFYYTVAAVAADGQMGPLSNTVTAGNLPLNADAQQAPPYIVFNFFMSQDVDMSAPLIALNRQPMIMVFGQDAAGSHVFTWPVNTRTHGTISLTPGDVSIQHFVWWAGLSPGSTTANPINNGTLYPTTPMVFT